MFSEPVVGEKFFGREEVLGLLNKRTLALKDGYRQNIALTGQSLSGKTSILHHFLHSIKEEDFITIYVEVVKEPFRSFSYRFIATLLYNALTKMGEAVGFELENLLDKAQELLPKTYSAIRNVITC
ncbi:MAG: ATP-binding protein, partial [Candidatus Omnitrophota bacterium]